MTTYQCPGCVTGKRRTTQYLCYGCWQGLTSGTRRQLLKKDGYAMRRLRKLHLELDKGTPLKDIRVSL